MGSSVGIVGVAFLKMRRRFQFRQMFPVLGLREQLPAFVWIVRGVLTAQRTHGAVANYVFHCHLPEYGNQSLSLLFASESLRL
jgi:hypothetical protein